MCLRILEKLNFEGVRILNIVATDVWLRQKWEPFHKYGARACKLQVTSATE
ncbi:hypothetical protein MAH1_04490 [Sessilibacter sp. MAH1]